MAGGITTLLVISIKFYLFHQDTRSVKDNISPRPPLIQDGHYMAAILDLVSVD
jgi:hypothetical protein